LPAVFDLMRVRTLRTVGQLPTVFLVRKHTLFAFFLRRP
jgi:hypothetical protein